MQIREYDQKPTLDTDRRTDLLTEEEAQELIDYLWRPGYPEYHEMVVKKLMGGVAWTPTTKQEGE